MSISLRGLTIHEIQKYLLEGGKLTDDYQTADMLLQSFVPLRAEYYEIAFLGDEYCVRTQGREYEAVRVPRTLGGVMILIANIESLNAKCALYIAQGGRNGF
ncbi:hypothetical protein E5U18_09730 [Salmonella enterica subsp. enterica serovar Typhimurium]|nr:hypothetical protein [Salmonella enterica subsp. enterica serovar Typhimurium]EEF4178130.1 hypothetical protein [Salmonella enterica]